MQKVAIVTDGSADLPKDLVMKYDIQIAPFKVIVDGEIYKMQGNYGDLTPQEFYNKLKNSKEYPTTAIPSPKDFDQAFKKGLQIAESVLAIVISEELSGTYQCALKVAEQFENEDITILDSRVATSTLGVLVVEAAKKAQQDASKEEIIDHLEKLIPKAQLVSVNDNVDAVYRSGRVGWVKKFLVDTFNVKPIIHFNEGKIVSGGTLREREAVREAMLKTGPKVVENSISDLIFIWHVQSEELAKELKEETEKHNPSGKEIRIIEAGPVIGTHVGEGSIAYMYVGDYKKEWLLNS